MYTVRYQYYQPILIQQQALRGHLESAVNGSEFGVVANAIASRLRGRGSILRWVDLWICYIIYIAAFIFLLTRYDLWLFMHQIFNVILSNSIYWSLLWKLHSGYMLNFSLNTLIIQHNNIIPSCLYKFVHN